MLRKVQLSVSISGEMYLHSMPGFQETLNTAINNMQQAGISSVYCMTGDKEIARYSPDYAASIKEGRFPFKRYALSIPDYGLPEDEHVYKQLVENAVKDLTAGKNILVHCRMGIGRAGTFACRVLGTLGIDERQALEWVRQAQAGPETEEQRLFAFRQ